MDTLTSELTLTAELTHAEATRLARLERTVDRAVAVVGRIAGEALATIRDERLYRLTHATFEAYCAERWGFSRATAYRMIDAAGASADRADHDAGDHQVDDDEGGNVSPRDKPSSDGADFADPDRRAPMAGEKARAWATVVDAGGGEVRVALDEVGLAPPAGRRVMLTWIA